MMQVFLNRSIFFFNWILSDRKSPPQFSRTFLSIFADFSRAEIWTFSILRIFRSSCNIGPKCCVWKKAVHRKRNTQTRNLRKKNSRRFYSIGLRWVAASKVRFIPFFLPLLLGGDGVSWSPACWYVPVSRIVAGWICTGRGLLNLWRSCIETCHELPKISWFDFLYRDFFETIRRFQNVRWH